MKSVYIATADPRRHKIGVSRDPARRLRGLSAASGYRLVLAEARPSVDAIAIERMAHWLLRAARLHGEWFAVDTATALAAVTEAVRRIEAGERVGDAKPKAPSAEGRTPWQIRLRAAALTQKGLAMMLDISENTVSRQMKGDWPVAGYVEAFVGAWEIMTPEQRIEWHVRRERNRP